MRRVDSLIVPVTFVVALLAVLSVTVSWVPHPPQLIDMMVKMGPPGIVPGRPFGLSFTPRNALSGHILTHLVPAQRHCVDVTITDASLRYVDPQRACRVSSGTYKLVYRFPRPDDYLIYVEMQPVGGLPHIERISLPLDLCTASGPHRHAACPPRDARLRGLEDVRSHTVRGVTVVLGAPAHAVSAGAKVQFSFVFLRRGRTMLDLQPIDNAPGQVVAVSMDTYRFTRLYPDPGQVARGRVKGSAISFTGQFATPSIYRVFGAFRYRNRPLRTSFVVDVNPAPTPTPSG